MANSEQSVSASDGGVIKDVRQTIINNAENVYLHESAIEVKLTDDEIAEARERYCQDTAGEVDLVRYRWHRAEQKQNGGCVSVGHQPTSYKLGAD